MELLHLRLGPHARVSDLVVYDSYEDTSKNAETFSILHEELKVTLGWGDQFINANTLLLRGDKVARLSGMLEA